MQIVFGLLFLLFFSACCLCVAACTRFDAALLPLPALCGSVVVLYLLSLLGLLQFGHFIVMAVWLALLPALAVLLRKTICPAITEEKAEAAITPLCACYAVLGAVLLFQHYFVGPVYVVYA